MLALLALLPLSVLHGLGRLLGALLHGLPGRARDSTYRNLRTCFPDQDESAIRRLARESLKHTASTGLEMGKAWTWQPDRIVALSVERIGYEAYREAVDSGQGVILLAPHLGNWEIFGYLAVYNVQATFMYQPPRSAAMDRILREGRNKTGVCLAPATRRGVAQVMKALSRGELVGILPDQVPADGSGEFAPFFGEPAYTMTLISSLLRRSEARVFCGFGLRLPGGKGFRSIFEEADPEITSADVAVSLGALNRTVENAVRRAPEQYQWEYKRFRRRPDNSEFY